MKNFYDKVLLGLALVLLGIGLAIFFKNGAVLQPAANPLATQAPSGPGYVSVTPPELPVLDLTWKAPVDQDAPMGAIYNVFTPPKIWWDKLNEKWIYVTDEPMDPIGLYFVGRTTELYRVQFKGFFGSATRPPIIVQLEDAEAADRLQGNLRGPVGAEFPANGIKVLDFKEERATNEDGTFGFKRVVTIQDSRLNRTVTLELNKPEPIPGREFLSFRTEPPYEPKNWQVRGVGDKLDAEGAKPARFTITAVNLSVDKPSATVEKQIVSSQEPPVLYQFTPDRPQGVIVRPAR